VRAILLDAGNTLVELDHVLLARHAGREVAAVRTAEHRARRILDLELGVPGRSTEAPDTLDRYLGLVFAELGLTSGWLPLLAMRRRLWTVPVPGASHVLTRLRRRGYRLGVVSNSDGSIAGVLAGLGLARHLEVIVDSGTVEVEKPDPAIFTFALDHLRLPADQVLYVGDLFHVDAVGACAAGLHAAIVDPAGNRSELEVPRLQGGIADLLALPLPLADGLA
jgi:putative hydrolase of the HAD superfamily